jgi:hypothetical protein
MQGLRVTKNRSTNPKLVGERRDIDFFATYRAVGPTCPPDCPLLGNGCYAQNGKVSWQAKDRYSEDDGAVFLRELGRLPQGAIVRLHVSGDVMLDGELDTAYLQALIDGAAARPDLLFFGYTHAWRHIDRERWVFPPNLVINASCDSEDDAHTARAWGWDVTTVVPSDTAWRRSGDTVICPNQTVGLSCYECKLCMQPDRKLSVAFKAHGTQTRKVDERLALPQAA